MKNELNMYQKYSITQTIKTHIPIIFDENPIVMLDSIKEEIIKIQSDKNIKNVSIFELSEYEVTLEVIKYISIEQANSKLLNLNKEIGKLEKVINDNYNNSPKRIALANNQIITLYGVRSDLEKYIKRIQEDNDEIL